MRTGKKEAALVMGCLRWPTMGRSRATGSQGPLKGKVLGTALQQEGLREED